MAIAVNKIHVGAARIWTGVTPGTTGTPPTYITHAAGVPSSGTDLGATVNDCNFTYKLNKQKIKVEQELMAVDVFSDDEMAQIDFECQEQTYNTLKQGFDNVGNENVGAGVGFYFGGGNAILTPNTTCVFVSSIQRNATTKFVIAVLYKAYTVEGYKISFSKSKPSTYKVTIEGLADLTRNAGDRAGYYRFEL